METAAEIILEIRGKLTRCGVFFGEDVRQWLDRLEAAIERDRTSRRSIKIPIEVVPELAGNAAAMREAHVAIRDAARQETVEDIVAVMRRGTKLPGFWRSCDLNKILEYHADRIEAAIGRAAQREIEDAAELAILRDRMREIRDRAIDVIDDDGGTYRKIVELAQEALAARSKTPKVYVTITASALMLCSRISSLMARITRSRRCRG